MLYVLVAIVVVLLSFYLMGCKKKDDETNPIPSSPPKRYEVPPEISEIMQSPEAIVRWGRLNYSMGSDKGWAKHGTMVHSDYPQTPAEFFSRRIKCAFCYDSYIEKPALYVGDCNNVNPLNAYFLSKIGWDAYVVTITTQTQGVNHMVTYAKKDGKTIIINNIWLYTQYSTFEKWLNVAYPKDKVLSIEKINDWLEKLYAKGHIRYLDEAS